jgi:hypothetical protein
VEVQFGEADRSSGPVPELTQVRPAQPSAFRANEDEALGAGSGEALQVVANLRRDVLRERDYPDTGARLRVVVDQMPAVRLCGSMGKLIIA